MPDVKRKAAKVQLYNNTKIVVAMIVAIVLSLFIANYLARDKQVAGCKRTVLDRTAHIVESHAGWKANTVVGTDPKQPKRTRDARLNQAKSQWKVVVSLEKRVPRENRITTEGKQAKQFSCEEAFPPLITFIK